MDLPFRRDAGVSDRRASALPIRSAEVLPHIPVDPRYWRTVLGELLKKYNSAHGSKAKGVSCQTQSDRAQFLVALFRNLRHDAQHAYRIDPCLLGRPHIAYTVRPWSEQGLSPATLEKNLSHRRVFSTWIGKAGLVVVEAAYGDDRARVQRTYSAKFDKRWFGSGIDPDALFAEVDGINPRARAQLRMRDAFGLRATEAIMIRPHHAVVDGCLAVVEHACRSVTARHESLRQPDLRLHQAYLGGISLSQGERSPTKSGPGGE
jgi:site-specific recombinase XerC